MDRHGLAGLTMLLVCTFMGCGAAFKGLVQENNQKARAKVASIAEFDLDCPRAKLKIQALTHYPNGRESTLGVRGCGKAARYQSVPNTEEWVLDGARKDAAQ